MTDQFTIYNFRNTAGKSHDIHLFYRFFGKEPGSAPVVLITHSLTGNEEVTGAQGWWKEVVGPGKIIDTEEYCVLCINIPGNGTGGRQYLLQNHREFTLWDIARLFSVLLEKLSIPRLFAATGGSIGGALLWHLAVLRPGLIQNLIPIATDIKATDWLLAHCKVQEQILLHSADPVRDARMHAMTFYRTPESLSSKFNRSRVEGAQKFEVEAWLEFHGEQLFQRFEKEAYLLMNHLLTTIDISVGKENPWAAAARIKGHIHLVGIDSDLFFLPGEIRNTYKRLSFLGKNVSYSEINSLHGHDAFLIEYPQLHEIFKPIFNTSKTNEKNKHCIVRNG